MCTICNATEFERKIAETDIPCYKLMRFENGQYYTPYYNMQMEIGMRYDNKDDEVITDGVKSVKIWWGDWDKYKEISQGFFHSYINYASADYYVQLFNKYRIETVEFHIIKCVIPKGTEYIAGFDINHSQPVYVSKSIVLQKKVFPHD